MSTAKTTISLDRELLGEAEAAARDLRTTRSGLIARALTEFLERRRADEITRKLNEVYGSEPPDEEEQPHLVAMLRLHIEALGDENPW